MVKQASHIGSPRQCNRSRAPSRPPATRAAGLERQINRLTLALDHMSQGLCMFGPDERLIVANSRYAEMYGLSDEHVTPGTPFRDVVEARVAAGAYAGQDAEAYVEERLAAVRERQPSVKFHTLPDGRVIIISHRPMTDGGWVATHEDITAQRRFEEKIAHMAHHDALTDLPNRTLFKDRLDTELAGALGTTKTGVLMIDLDGFKQVNDTLGHSIGDKLLQAVGGRLAGSIRKTDTVARMGGDEFAIIQPQLYRLSQAESLARRLINVLSQPFAIEGQQVAIGASVGIALGPRHGHDSEELLRNADLALYDAKFNQRGTYAVFTPSMENKAHDRMRTEMDLRAAIVRQEFILHYQPIVDLKSKKVTGVEALVRWQHPERGLISPAAFIPIAEASGLIVPLGEWVVKEACATVARWPGDITLAVNLSGAQLKCQGLTDTVIAALADSGLPARRLELEITESMLIEGSEAVLDNLARLGSLGIKIVMDDFGTGHSSLKYLHSLPFHKIKIDRSFVQQLPTSTKSLAIVRAVTAMANGLGMKTTVEGIETQDQLDVVCAEGCTEMQGFLFSRPVPASAIESQYLEMPQLERATAS